MALRCPAICGSTIGEDPVHRNLVLLEERQDPIIQELRGRDRGLAVIQLCEAHFAVGVDEGLLGDPAHAFQGPDIERILGATVAGTFALEFPMGFFVSRGLLQRDDWGFRQDETFLGYLRLQRLQPFSHRLQVMPQPDAPNPCRGDGQGLLAQFVRNASLPPGWLIERHLDNGVFHLGSHAILEEWFLSGNLLERGLAAGLVQLLKAVEAIAAVAHQPTGVGNIVELLG